MLTLANSPKRGYADYLQYGFESTFGTAASTIDKVAGREVRYSFKATRNPDEGRDLGDQELTNMVDQEYGGEFTLSFKLANPWILRSVLGAAPATTGSGPYTHTWNSTQGISDDLPSLTFNLGRDDETDSDINLLGAVANTMTVSTSLESPVEVSLSGIYRSQTQDTTLDTTPASETFDYFVARQVDTSFNGGAALPYITDLNFTLERSTEFDYSVGDHLATSYSSGNRNHSVSITRPVVNYSDFLQLFEGSASSTQAESTKFTSLEFAISNGLAGVNERSITFTYGTTHVVNVEQALSEIGERRQLPIELRPYSLTTVTAVNNTAAAP